MYFCAIIQCSTHKILGHKKTLVTEISYKRFIFQVNTSRIILLPLK